MHTHTKKYTYAHYICMAWYNYTMLPEFSIEWIQGQQGLAKSTITHRKQRQDTTNRLIGLVDTKG